MKKITYGILIALGVYALQGCHSGSKSTQTIDTATTTADSTGAATTDTTKADSSDVKFANNAAAGGMAEIKLSELAQQKTSDAKIKDFAAMMVKDHSAAGDSLMVIAKNQNITLPTTMDADHQKKYDELSKLSGSAFDKTYVKIMVADHEGALALMQNEAKNSKDPKMADFATKTAAMVQRHLDAINKIAENMK